MTDLTDTQSLILGTACARENGLIFPVTTKLKGGAVGNICKKPPEARVDRGSARRRPGHSLAAWRSGFANPTRHPARLFGAWFWHRRGCCARCPARPDDSDPAKRHEAGADDRHAERAGWRYNRRDRHRNRMAQSYRERIDVRGAEEEARPDHHLGKGRWPGALLPYW